MEESLVVFDNSRLTALDPANGAVRWCTDLPECGRRYGRMVITEGVVLVAGFERLFCCDLTTGRLHWWVPTRKGALVGLAARGGRIYVYKNGAIDCFDGRGQRLWSHEATNQYVASMGFTGDICWVPYEE
jgi:outer membrane protein assembly factor BamB